MSALKKERKKHVRRPPCIHTGSGEKDFRIYTLSHQSSSERAKARRAQSDPIWRDRGMRHVRGRRCADTLFSHSLVSSSSFSRYSLNQLFNIETRKSGVTLFFSTRERDDLIGKQLVVTMSKGNDNTTTCWRENTGIDMYHASISLPVCLYRCVYVYVTDLSLSLSLLLSQNSWPWGGRGLFFLPHRALSLARYVFLQWEQYPPSWFFRRSERTKGIPGQNHRHLRHRQTRVSQES